MHKNFSLKFHWYDLIVIVTSIVIAIGFIVGILGFNNSLNSKHRYVNIYHNNVLLEDYKYDLNKLDENIIITLSKDDYPDLLGDFKIEISKSKGVRVYDSEDYTVNCPNHDCKKLGWVNMYNFPIVCIPNDVRIEITGSNSSGDATLG